jgi:glycosyltransferase involved in cell wall biosynthesis
MVAAEGAACGALPISAAHSGLAEVSAVLAQTVPEPAAHWLSFPVDDHAVQTLAEHISNWLQADPPLRARTRRELVATTRKHWSWEGVAQGVLAAAHGELDTLAKPTWGLPREHPQAGVTGAGHVEQIALV